MSSDRRLEQDLPSLLDDLYLGPMPTYRDHVLQQTARARQRPAWTFIQRWLPMLDIARQPVLAPRIPWRTIGLGVALVALLVAMVAALAVGTRPNPPAPFGLARNGLVAYATDGDIYTVDPVTGNSTAIVTGPVTDINPRWSRDGTRLAFERKTQGDRGPGLLFVTRADGSEPILVTPEPLPGIESYSFSPDGTELLISAHPGRIPGILIAATDGSQIRQLDLPGPATKAAWRPPDGSEILFMDSGDHFIGFGGMYAIDVDTGEIRTILERASDRHRAEPIWSPDGSQIAYVEWVDSGNLTAQTRVIAADGTGDRLLPVPPDAVWQAPRSWSNDGTRLLAIRGYTGGYEESVAVALPADGHGFGVEIAYPDDMNGPCCSAWEWAPDDSLILGTPIDTTSQPLEQVLLDPVTGTSRAVPWTTTSLPSWQRLAP